MTTKETHFIEGVDEFCGHLYLIMYNIPQGLRKFTPVKI